VSVPKHCRLSSFRFVQKRGGWSIRDSKYTKRYTTHASVHSSLLVCYYVSIAVPFCEPFALKERDE